MIKIVFVNTYLKKKKKEPRQYLQWEGAAIHARFHPLLEYLNRQHTTTDDDVQQNIIIYRCF